MHVLGYNNSPIRFEMAAREKVQHHRLCAIRSRLEDNPISAERARTGGWVIPRSRLDHLQSLRRKARGLDI